MQVRRMTSVKMDFDELSVRISTITDAVINAERMHKQPNGMSFVAIQDFVAAPQGVEFQ
jgi:hypothetical protein